VNSGRRWNICSATKETESVLPGWRKIMLSKIRALPVSSCKKSSPEIPFRSSPFVGKSLKKNAPLLVFRLLLSEKLGMGEVSVFAHFSMIKK